MFTLRQSDVFEKANVDQVATQNVVKWNDAYYESN